MSNVEFTAGNWNPFDVRAPRTNAGIAAGPGGMSKRQHKRAMEMLQQHHSNVMEHLGASYGHETQFQTSLSGLREAEAGGQHSRNLEFFKTTTKGAQGGTGYKTTMPGGYSLEMTTKEKPPRKTKGAPIANTFPPKTLADEPQQELPSTPTASTIPTKTTGPTVARDPKTGKAVSLKNKPVTSSPVGKTKKTAPVKPAASKGRARSVKKK